MCVRTESKEQEQDEEDYEHELETDEDAKEGINSALLHFHVWLTRF